MSNSWTLSTAVGGSILAVAMLGAQTSTQDDKVVPVHEEPRHRVVFNSPNTRILDIQIPPGDTTLFHTHSDPILYVTMSTSQTRSQTLGREWSGGGATPAATPAAAPTPASPTVLGRMMSTTSYAQTPQTHRVNNIGATLFRLIGVTNASAGDPGTAPSADFDGKPEIENRWFRGYRWMLDSATLHEHRHANAAALVIVAGRATLSTTDAAATDYQTLEKPGDFAWVDAGEAHRLQNAGGAAQLVEIEVRRPR